MAAEIDQPHHHLHDHQAFFDSTSRFCPELSFDRQQIEYESGSSVSISAILDQGSISFGKYASEVLAWEKRSVFSHDRFQEELEKFKNPGSVAQKKAYFEEYYKKLRAMKDLQAEQLETSELEACQNAQYSTKQIHSENITASNLNLSSSGCTVYDSEQATEAQNCSTKTTQKKSPVFSAVTNKANQPKKQLPGLQAKGTVASVRNKTMLESCKTTKNTSKVAEKPKPTLGKVIPKNGNSLLPIKKSDPKPVSKIKRQIMEGCTPATAPNTLLAKDKPVSSFSSVRACPVKPSTTSQGLAGKLPTRLLFNAQATKPLTSSSVIRTHQMKLSTTCKGSVKLPARSSVQVQSAKPASFTSSKRIPQEKPNTAAKVLAGKLPTRSSSVKFQSATPLSSTSSMKIHPEKPTTSSEGLPGKLPSKSSIHVPCAKQESSSSSIRTRPVSTAPQGLVKKLPTKLPVNSESSKSVSKDNASTSRLRNLVKRSANLSSPSKSSQNIATDLGQRSLVQEGKKKELKEKAVAELRRDQRAAASSGSRRDLKPASSMVSNISRSSRGKPVPEISRQQFAEEKCGRVNTTTKSVCRQITP